VRGSRGEIGALRALETRLRKYAAAVSLLAVVAGAVPMRAQEAPVAGASPALSPEQKMAKLAGRATGRVIYRGATLINGAGAGAANERLAADMSIVVDGEMIKAIAPWSALDKSLTGGAEVVDARGLFATPGLIDSHVHYATQPQRAIAEAELKRDVYGGLTGVRDMAGDARALADLARAALINEIPAPDIFYSALVAGPSFFEDPRTLSSSLGLRSGQVPWLYAVTGDSELPLVVAQARGTGATGLKIYANLPGPLVRALIAEAKRQHFPVWTHQQVYPATPYDSLGATSVSHVCMIARFIREPGKSSYGRGNEPSYDGLSADEPGIAHYIAALAKSGTIMDATLSVYFPPAAADGKGAVSKRCPLALAGDITRKMFDAGVPIAAGTDAGAGPDNPYPALYAEMEALVRNAGLTPAQAIIAATRNGAAALEKQGEFGTLEPGKYANLAFFKDNPALDIANLRSVVLTVKRGTRFWRKDYHHQPIPDEPD
jgi:amidohydrolase family protein